MAPPTGLGYAGSYAGSAISSRSSSSGRARAAKGQEGGPGEDLLDRRSTLENGIFGVLFTLSKESNESRLRVRWVLLKALIDAWQLFTTVITPAKQGWRLNGRAWAVVSVLNFTWLADLGYGAYLAVLYSMVVLLAVNIVMCLWVAWCFKEHKFPVVWPIKVLRVFSSVFFQVFDVTSLNLLQLGISCRFTGPYSPKMRFQLFPEYSCSSSPHITHAVVSGLSLVLFVAIALLLNMAEVEVNPLSRRPLALGHSGVEVMSFAIKVGLTLVDVFIGWKQVAACFYLALSLALAYQYIRWGSNLVAWMNYLKSGVSVAIAWCSAMLVLLVFHPGIKTDREDAWSSAITTAMLAGLAPAFGAGALMSWAMIRYMTSATLKAIANAKPETPLEEVCDNVDDPRDIEMVTRCCRVWIAPRTPDPEAVNKAHQVIKTGVAMFPNSAYMVLLHANFMIDVLGIHQSGSRRIEDARKLNPGLMCRFIMFVRQQQATQKAAGSSANDGSHMDLLGYVEYQRKQRMVVRLHREALQAMCNFWKALDASSISFVHLSKALGKIETSVSQAQTAYRVVLESYGNSPKLVRLYGKFLLNIKNDPWGASEYFAEAERLEEVKEGDTRGPLLPDGTPLGRMDELSIAVLVVNVMGEVQVANRQTYQLFGYKRGMLEGKLMSALLAPHCTHWLSAQLAELVAETGLAAAVATGVGGGAEEAAQGAHEAVLVGMHAERLAFPVKVTLRRVSGVGDDTTMVAMLEPLPPVRGVSSLWVAHNGTVAACDPQFVATFGWRSGEVNGVGLTTLVSVPKPDVHGNQSDVESQAAAVMAKQQHAESASDVIKRLLAATKMEAVDEELGVRCLIAHKYDSAPIAGYIRIVANGAHDVPVYEVRLALVSDPAQLMVVNNKGAILHVSADLAACLKDGGDAGGGAGGIRSPRRASLTNGPPGFTAPGFTEPQAPAGKHMHATELLSGYTLADFLPPPWRDMHAKFLKSTTALSAPGRLQWSCRKGSPPGPTLELRSATGKPLYMRVSVATTDLAGELTHVVRLASSSLESALGERRLRLSLSEDGRIADITGGAPAQLFGLDATQLIGRGLWEVIEEPASIDAFGAASAAPAQRMFNNLLSRALTYPEHSWRVRVLPPPRQNRSTAAGLAAAARGSMAKLAVLQVHVELPPEHASIDQAPDVYVDLWPISSLTGVLELDGSGRISAVLEEGVRPAGLLFGLPSAALVGTALEELVALPPGRSSPGDLLSLHGAKKSSLKVDRKQANFKVGPMHVLQGAHSDGRPLALEVQVVGKPGPNQPLTAILRPHVAPMLPANMRPATGAASSTAANAPAASAPSMLRASGVAGGRSPSAGALRRASTVGSPLAAPRAPPSGTAEKQTSFLLSSKPSLQQPTHHQQQQQQQQQQQRQPQQQQQQQSSTQLTLSPRPSAIHQQQQQQQQLQDTPPSISPTASKSLTPSPPPPSANLASGSYEARNRPSSDDVEVFAAELAPPPDLLLCSNMSGGLPLPGVTAGKAAALAGRSKLADLVKSVDGERVSATSGVASPAVEAALSRRRRGSSLMLAGLPEGHALSQAFSSPLQPGEEPVLPGATPRTGQGFGPAPASSPAPTPKGGAAEREEGDHAPASDSDAPDPSRLRKASKLSEATERISTWVASKGAYYQNSVCAATVKGDDDLSDRSEDLLIGRGLSQLAAVIRAGSTVAPEAIVPEVQPNAMPPLPPPRGGEPESAYVDDDAASEGGQSAMSAQSAGGGAEYKRGKRFRKLAKMMDSSQAQQVQSRFRMHALGVVAVLMFSHIICFVFTVTAIQSQRVSMLKLGRAGQSQRYMHRISTDVRSLDVISRNKTVPNLYSAADAPAFLARIRSDAEEVKVRLNEMLFGHHSSNSLVMGVLYYSKWQVWDGNYSNGTDKFTNVTIWDFGTMFYTYSKDVVQQYDTWVAQGINIADTPAGQFLIKSGPDLWRASRRALDALLYVAVNDARTVDTLQLVFLAVEGAFITCLSACYVAYLLRAVAAQRFKLYSTFLVIPLGLTRALASQNTNLLIDDEEDEGENDDERAGANDDDDHALQTATKAKRRAVLNVAQTPGESAADTLTSSRRANRHSGVAAAAAAAGLGGRGGMDAMEPRASVIDKLPSPRVGRALTGCLSWMARPFKRTVNVLSRRRGRGVNPFPTPSTVGALTSASGKRSLKYDSHETLLMMVPFVLWSALVIAMYSTAVVKMKDVVDVVAVHSVANFLAARAYRTVFFTQELAVVEDPALLPSRRAALMAVRKVLSDAYYTLQLGADAFRATGPETERFPLVKEGLAHATTRLQDIFYSSGRCHRLPEHMPCPGPEYRFYQIIWTGIDSIMQQYLLKVSALASSNSTIPPGLADGNVDLVYNVGTVDLSDGTVEIQDAHYESILALFNRILLLHIILFLLMWAIVALFLFLLLNPLLKRVTKERRRIAELMSQLPLELDVEKLVERALGTATATGDMRGTGSGMAELQAGGGNLVDGHDSDSGADATSKWKAIIRTASTQAGNNLSFRRASSSLMATTR